MELLSVDIFGPLPTTFGNFKYIVVVMDVFSKFTKLYRTTNVTTNTCKYALNQFFEEFEYVGPTKTILTDNGPQFRSEHWISFWEEKGYECRFTSVYHPQVNPVETRMKIIGDCLRVLCPTKHRNWYLFLDDIEHRLNDTFHRTTGFPPATLMQKVKFTLSGQRVPMKAAEHAVILEKAREETKHQLERRRKENQSKTLTEFTVGSQVYVRNFVQSDADQGRTKKMLFKWIGPCEILERRGLNSYLIRRSNGSVETYHISNIHH